MQEKNGFALISERNKQKPFPTLLTPWDTFQTEYDRKTIEKCTIRI